MLSKVQLVCSSTFSRKEPLHTQYSLFSINTGCASFPDVCFPGDCPQPSFPISGRPLIIFYTPPLRPLGPLLILRIGYRRYSIATTDKHVDKTANTPNQQKPRRRPGHAKELVAIRGRHVGSVPVGIDQSDEFKRERSRNNRGDAEAESAKLSLDQWCFFHWMIYDLPPETRIQTVLTVPWR